MKKIILISALFIFSVCSAQISIKNDTLHFDKTTNKGAVIWISSESIFRMAKYTVRGKDRDDAVKFGWSIKSWKLPKGIFIIEYIYKKRNTKVTYINK